MRLNEIQKRFHSTMLDHPDALQSLPEDFAKEFVHDDIALDQRLTVYRNNIVGGLTDTLIASYPVLDKLVGHDFLERIARSYVLENPPQTGCLNLYGCDFAGFIRNFGPAKSLPYLPDVATFEAAMTQSYYAPDDQALKADSLASIPEDTLPETLFKLCSSVYLLQSKYPLTTIRDYCLAETQEGTLDLDQGGCNLLIYRPEIEVLIVTLEDDELTMLQSIAKGSTLGNALENTLSIYPAFDIAAFLSRHLDLRTFASL